MEGLRTRLAAVRRNHALEHATIAVLMARVGRPLQLVGRATADGFYLLGNVPPEEVMAAARDALDRLRRGETHLALSPMCGTNLVTAGLLAGLAAFAVLRRGVRWGRLPEVVMACTGAVALAQPLGRWAQRRLTTSVDLEGMAVAEVRRLAPGLPLYKVCTRWKGRPSL